MQILEKIFKNRFKDKQSLEGIDSDDLWESIAGSMDNTPVTSIPNTSKWLFTLLYLVFSGWLLLYLTHSNTQKEYQTIATKAIASSKENESKITGNNLEQETEICKDDQNINTARINSVTSKTNITTQKKAVQTQNERNNEIGTPVRHTPIITNVKKKKNTLLFNIASAIPPVKNENTQLARPTKNETQHKRFKIRGVETLALQVAYTPQNEVNFTKKPLSVIQIPIKPLKKWPLEVFVGAGTNTIFTQYRGNENQTAIGKELEAATNYFAGFSSTLKVAYLINDKYSISSGLNYDLTQTIFKRSTVKSSTRLETHYLLAYQLNPAGDSINKMYGDKLLNTLETQKVVHRNQFKQISIPLAFGVRKKAGKLGLGIDLGISYNYFLSQKGKSIDAEKAFYAFDDTTSSTRPFKTSFFAFQLNPFLDMQMTEKLKFRLSATLKYEPQGISNLYQVNQYTIFAGFSGGLVFVL